MIKLAPLLLAATALLATPVLAEDAPANPATSTPEATAGIGPGARPVFIAGGFAASASG